MDPIQFSIQNPVKVAVGVLLLLLFGLVALGVIPVQLVPNVDQPIINVRTDWIGRSPDEVEREIIEEQEDRLKTVSNLRKMTATATVGRSEIELEFFIGTDLRAARQEVSDALREVSEYPEDVDEPVITTGESGSGDPVAWLILTSDDPDYDVQTLGDLAEERVKPVLERIPGVSEIRVYGGRGREVHLEIDPAKLAQRGITFNQLREALQLENVNVSAGDLAEGKYDLRVRTVGQYDDLDAVRETIVSYGQGGPVRIKDLGVVEQNYEKRRSFVRSRGQLALAFPIYREAGANVIKIIEGTKRYKGLVERIEDINEPGGVLTSVARQAAAEQGLDEPPKLSLKMVYNETGYIFAALGLVKNNLFIGGILAALVLLLFLRKVRPTIIVVMAIPISVIGTFVVMAGAGRNINVISLAGLAFAVGMVVDNAIVVLENIDRHLGMGKTPMKAAYDAAREVWGAIVASTLTTLAVFLPVLTIQEEAGQLFRDIALAICAAVTLSLIVAVTVIPTSAGRFVRASFEPKTKFAKAGRTLFGLLPYFAKIAEILANLVYRACGSTVARLSVVVTFTLVSVIGAWLLMPPTDYLPRGNKNIVFGGMLTPPGYNMEQNQFIGSRVGEIIQPYWEATSYDDLKDLPTLVHPFTGLPIENAPPLENYFFVSFNSSLFGGATSLDSENVRPIGDVLTSAWNTVPGVIGFAEQASLFGRGLAGTRQIDVEVTGVDLDKVREVGELLQGRLREMFGFPKVRPTPANFDMPQSELQVTIDRVRARELGIDVASLGLGVRTLVDGITIGDFRLSGESIDIVAKRPATMDLNAETLGQIPLAYRLADGGTGTIPLAAVADLDYTLAAQSILRIEELRAVKLEVVPPDDMPLQSAGDQIVAMIDGLKADGTIPVDVDAELGGSADKLAEVREAMLGRWQGFTRESLSSVGGSRLFLAMLVTYLLMAALFESWLYPFVIMFSVPLAAVGGFLGLRLMHMAVPDQNLDVLTMLGFVILIGVVVNNAILIVHQALNFMRGLETEDNKPMEAREAIRESVRSRVRPICMTTLTSVAGMLPLVLMPGSGSELYKGLGSVVIGGLFVSTLFTLFLVPLLFSLVIDARTRLWKS